MVTKAKNGTIILYNGLLYTVTKNVSKASFVEGMKLPKQYAREVDEAVIIPREEATYYWLQMNNEVVHDEKTYVVFEMYYKYEKTKGFILMVELRDNLSTYNAKIWELEQDIVL
jgi:hypothetical protein